MLSMTEKIVITKHAYMRMKERNGWNKKAATRMASRVFTVMELGRTRSRGILRIGLIQSMNTVT